jgi:hypothetical protein
MELGGHRNNSATKAGISESESCDRSGVLSAHVVKSGAQGPPMMQTKGNWWVRYDPVTRTAPGKPFTYCPEWVKVVIERTSRRPDGI